MLCDQKSLAQLGVGVLVCCTPPPHPTQEFILTTQHAKGLVWAGPKPPPPSYKIGPNCCFGALAQLIHVVACFVLCTAFFVLPLLPLSACCILGPYTTAMACMFLQWTKPEAALPQTLALTAYMALPHVHIPSEKCHCMPWLKLQPFCLCRVSPSRGTPIGEFSVAIVVCW